MSMIDNPLARDRGMLGFSPNLPPVAPSSGAAPATPAVGAKSASAGPPTPANTQPATTQPTTTGAPDPLSWQSYQQMLTQARQDPNWNGPTVPDEATWNAMSASDRYNFISQNMGFGTSAMGRYGLLATNAQSQAFAQQFGNPNGQLIMGYGPNPTLFGVGPDQFAIDPSRIVHMPDGSWVMESSNVNQQWYNSHLNADQHSGLDLSPAWAALPLAFAGGAALLDGFGGSTAAVADNITNGLGTTLDTSLMPNVTAPATIPMAADPVIPDLPGVPPVGPTGGAPGSAIEIPGQMPNVTAPTTGTMVPTPDITTPGSLADRITNGLLKDPLRTVGTAATVGSLLGKKPESGVPQSATTTNNNNATLNNQATATLTNNGQPTPDQLKVIDATLAQTRQRALEGIMQASVNSGMGGTDSMVTQDKIRALDEQLATLRVQMVKQQADQNVQNALKELGTTDQAVLALAQMQLNQDQLAMERTMSIMESLGWLFGSG